MADQIDPAKHAERLAQRHRWALLWLPADGTARHEAPYRLAPFQLVAPPDHLRPLFEHVVQADLEAGTEIEAWRLTPLGCAVRALIAAQYPAEARLFEQAESRSDAEIALDDLYSIQREAIIWLPSDGSPRKATDRKSAPILALTVLAARGDLVMADSEDTWRLMPFGVIVRDLIGRQPATEQERNEQ